MTEIMLTSSVLILLLVILRQVLRGKINPCLQYALWLLAAARLLVPGTFFPAPVSVLGAAEKLQTSLHEIFPGPAANGITGRLPRQEPVPAIPSGAVYPDGDMVVNYQPVIPETEITLKVHNWPDMIWKTGIAITGGTMAAANLVFYLRVRKNRKRLTLPADSWPRKLPVYGTEGLPSPCLFGLFRPAIYLNAAAMAAEHPEHILAHEYAHYRHGDHVWAVLRCVCLAVHWYNPLVWWAAALSSRDCELACDAAALRRLGEDARIDYGQTLLEMASRNRNPAALLPTATTMTVGKQAMKERIAFIIKQPKMRKITVVLVALVVCGAVAATFGGKAVAAETEPEPEENMPAAVVISQIASSQTNDTSRITDPDEVARLWELYQGFEYEGAYDSTGMKGWFIGVSFQFGDKPDDDTDVFFILTEHGVYTQDGEDLRLKNIDEIYAEFLRLSRSAPITPSDSAPVPAAGDASVLYADEIAEWEQWFQGYMEGLSAAPDGEIIYDSMEERSLYGQVHAYLYPYASDYFGEGFARNCYDYDVQLGFSVPNELTQPQLTVQYYVIVYAAIQLPNGELHGLRLTSRELTTTLEATGQMDMMTQMLVDGASGNLPEQE